MVTPMCIVNHISFKAQLKAEMCLSHENMQKTINAFNCYRIECYAKRYAASMRSNTASTDASITPYVNSRLIAYINYTLLGHTTLYCYF